MNNPQALKGHSRLIVLAALARQPMHGYALSEYLKDEMADLFKFGVGMLYPLLHQLEKEKLIMGKWQQLVGSDRRVYSLTKKGQKELEAKKAEWLVMTNLVGKLVNEFAV